MKWNLKLLKLLLFVLSLSAVGCSQISIGYKFADWAVEKRIDDNFDLNGEQKNRLEKRLDTYFKWHKENMMGEYAQYIENGAELIVKGDTSNESWDKLDDQFKLLYERTAVPFVPILAEVMRDLESGQIDHFKKQIEKKNNEHDEKFVENRSEYLEDRFDKNREMFKQWVGTIEGDQEKKLKEMTKQALFPVDSWLKKRRKQQAELIALVSAKHEDTQKIEMFLLNYVKQKPTGPLTKKYYEERSAYQKKLRTHLLGILRTLTAEQKNYLVNRLTELSQELREIAGITKAKS